MIFNQISHKIYIRKYWRHWKIEQKCRMKHLLGLKLYIKKDLTFLIWLQKA